MKIWITWAGLGIKADPREVVIIVDVLRASSSVVTALSLGARLLIPIEEINQARHLAEKHNAILMGERGMHKVAGFDIGNSPSELIGADLAEKVVILTSTNFPAAYRLGASAGLRLIGALLNVSAVTKHAVSISRQHGSNLLFMLSGEGGSPCDEDLAFVLAAVKTLEEQGIDPGKDVLNAVFRLRDVGASEAIIRSCHAKRLVELGYQEDVTFCSLQDNYAVVPVGEPEGVRPYQTSRN